MDGNELHEKLAEARKKLQESENVKNPDVHELREQRRREWEVAKLEALKYK